MNCEIKTEDIKELSESDHWNSSGSSNNCSCRPSESTTKAEGPLQTNSYWKQRQNCVGYSRQEMEAVEQAEDLG